MRRYFEGYEDLQNVYLLYEKIPGPPFFEMLGRKSKVSYNRIGKLAKNIVSGLNYACASLRWDAERALRICEVLKAEERSYTAAEEMAVSRHPRSLRAAPRG